MEVKTSSRFNLLIHTSGRRNSQPQSVRAQLKFAEFNTSTSGGPFWCIVVVVVVVVCGVRVLGVFSFRGINWKISVKKSCRWRMAFFDAEMRCSCPVVCLTVFIRLFLFMNRRQFNLKFEFFHSVCWNV